MVCDKYCIPLKFVMHLFGAWWVLHLLWKNKSNIYNIHRNPNSDTMLETLWFVMGIASKFFCDESFWCMMGIASTLKNKSNICNTHRNPNSDTILETLWFVMGIASKNKSNMSYLLLTKQWHNSAYWIHYEFNIL